MGEGLSPSHVTKFCNFWGNILHSSGFFYWFLIKLIWFEKCMSYDVLIQGTIKHDVDLVRQGIYMVVAQNGLII